MLGTAHGPPTFTKNNKFDRSNWIAFKNLIIVATGVCGAMEYVRATGVKLQEIPQRIR